MDSRRNSSSLSTISKTSMNGVLKGSENENDTDANVTVSTIVNESNDQNQQRQTFLDAFRGFVKGISIEPMVFVKYMTDRIYVEVQHNLKLERFCTQSLNYTDEECLLMDDGNHTDMQVEAQQLDTSFGIYETMAYTIVPLFVVLFAGSWSDRYGRKIPLCSTVLGYVMYMAVYFLVALFPSCPLQVLLVGEFLKGLGGGPMMYLMAVYSFLADRTTTGDRLYRMAIANAIWHLGAPAGVLLGALIFDKGGYLWVFGTSLMLYVFCILYICIIIKDKNNSKSDNVGSNNPRHFVETLRFAFRKHPNRGRIHLFILIATILMCISSLAHNKYLWTRRLFGWDLDNFSIWESIDMTFHQTLMLFVAPLLATLGIHDLIFGAMAMFLTMSATLWQGCATRADQWWFVYATTLIDLFPMLPAVTIRSSVSKIFNEDAGKAFSLLATLEVLWLLVNKTIYVNIYEATVDSYPSAQFFVNAMFSFAVILALISTRFSMRHVERKNKGKLEVVQNAENDIVRNSFRQVEGKSKNEKPQEIKMETD